MKVRACVRSGLCCTKGPCAFGEWDAAASKCKFLEIEQSALTHTIYRCGKYDEINALPPEARADVNPAFGAGCCMSMFNTNRHNIIVREHGGQEQWVDVVELRSSGRRSEPRAEDTTT